MTWVSISAITRTRSLEIGLDERLQIADKSHRVIIISEVEAFEGLGEFLDEKKREGMLVIMVIVLYWRRFYKLGRERVSCSYIIKQP